MCAASLRFSPTAAGQPGNGVVGREGIVGLLSSCFFPHSEVWRAVEHGGAPHSEHPAQEAASGRNGSTLVSGVCLSLFPARSPSKSTGALWTPNHGIRVFLEANQSVVTVQVQTSQTQPAKLHRSTVCCRRVGEPAYYLVCRAKSMSYQGWVLFREISIRSVSINRLWIVAHTLFN